MLRLSLFMVVLYSSFAVSAFYLPLYFQFRGLDTQEIGLAMAAGSIASIIGQPFWGLVSDRNRTIKKVLALLILLGLAASTPLFMSRTAVLIMAFMMLFMFFFSSVGPLADSLVMKYAYENNRSFGAIRLWGEVGVGISALLLGLAIERVGMNYLFFMFAFLIAFALLSMYGLPDAKPHAVPVSKESLKRLISTRPFLLYLLFMLFVSVPHRMNDVMMVLFLSELGASESISGMAWTVATFCAVPAMATVGILIRKYGELPLVIVAVFLYAVRWAIYSFATAPLHIVWAQTLHLLTFPIVFVASVQFVFKIVPDELKSTGQTLFTSVYFGIGGIIGNAGGGWVMETFGAKTMYLTGSVLCILCGLMLLLSYKYLSAQSQAYVQSASSE